MRSQTGEGAPIPGCWEGKVCSLSKKNLLELLSSVKYFLMSNHSPRFHIHLAQVCLWAGFCLCQPTSCAHTTWPPASSPLLQPRGAAADTPRAPGIGPSAVSLVCTSPWVRAGSGHRLGLYGGQLPGQQCFRCPGPPLESPRLCPPCGCTRPVPRPLL